MPEIIHYCLSSDCEFVAQKYIETPLLINQRKFDIRQWVLVNSFDELEIWIYNEYYLRFAANNYDSTNFNNKFSHLTNACITKKDKLNEEIFECNMLDKTAFKNYLSDINHTDKFFAINKMIEEQIIQSIQSAHSSVSSRKNSFSVFGFDFMIDSKFKVWLIEINSSPSMDMGTPVTRKLVPDFQRDIVRWLIDYDIFGKKIQNVYTGNLRLLYKDSRTTVLDKIERRFKRQI